MLACVRVFCSIVNKWMSFLQISGEKWLWMNKTRASTMNCWTGADLMVDGRDFVGTKMI